MTINRIDEFKEVFYNYENVLLWFVIVMDMDMMDSFGKDQNRPRFCYLKWHWALYFPMLHHIRIILYIFVGW